MEGRPEEVRNGGTGGQEEERGHLKGEEDEGLQDSRSGREDCSFSQARWKKRMKGTARRGPIGK